MTVNVCVEYHMATTLLADGSLIQRTGLVTRRGNWKFLSSLGNSLDYLGHFDNNITVAKNYTKY